MPNDSRSYLARGLAKLGGGIESRMSSRKKRLDGLGSGKTGGMFDIIYRKKRERETAMKDAYSAL